LVVNKPLYFKPGDVRCPSCFHLDIVPSMPRGWIDALMGRFGKIPRHCRSCGKRFYIPAQSRGGPAPAAGVER
jgi:ribosomal protein S27E